MGIELALQKPYWTSGGPWYEEVYTKVRRIEAKCYDSRKHGFSGMTKATVFEKQTLGRKTNIPVGSAPLRGNKNLTVYFAASIAIWNEQTQQFHLRTKVGELDHPLFDTGCYSAASCSLLSPSPLFKDRKD